MKYVVNSANTNPTYAFFMPIVCRMWKRRGYEPIAIMLGTESEWRSNLWSNYIYEHTHINGKIYHIDRVGGISDTTVIQSSRLFICAWTALQTTDYLLTSDVDMLPLSNSWFHQNDGKEFQIWGADAYGRTRFPICYLGGTINAWRNIMGIKTSVPQEAVATGIERSKDNWNYDEQLFFRKITANPIYPNRCQFIDRGWPGGIANGRLDRVSWNWNNQTNLIDAHCFRPGFTREHWGPVSAALKAYSSPEDFAYFCSYESWFETH